MVSIKHAQRPALGPFSQENQTSEVKLFNPADVEQKYNDRLRRGTSLSMRKTTPFWLPASPTSNSDFEWTLWCAR